MEQPLLLRVRGDRIGCARPSDSSAGNPRARPYRADRISLSVARQDQARQAVLAYHASNGFGRRGSRNLLVFQRARRGRNYRCVSNDCCLELSFADGTAKSLNRRGGFCVSGRISSLPDYADHYGYLTGRQCMG